MSKLIARKNIREGVDLAIVETGKASGGLIGTFVNLNLLEMPSDMDFSQFTRVDSKGIRLIHRLSHQVSRAKKGNRLYNNENRIKQSKEKLNMNVMMDIFDNVNGKNLIAFSESNPYLYKIIPKDSENDSFEDYVKKMASKCAISFNSNNNIFDVSNLSSGLFK